MSCFLVNHIDDSCHIAIEELQSLEFKDGKIIINGIVEFKPEEIMELRYEKK